MAHALGGQGHHHAARGRQLGLGAVHDGERLVAQLEAGRPLDATGRLLPATIPATIQMASGYHNLPDALRSLAELYQRQSEIRLARVPIVLTPLLLILIALSITFVIMGLLAPLARILQQLTG